MQNTSITIRTDKEIKNQVKELYAALGMDLTTAVNIFFRQSLIRNGVPFEVTLDVPNAATAAAMKAAENDDDVYGPFDSVADLMESLNA